MEFVKKNIVLVVVLVLTGLVSLYLIYMDVIKHSEVIKANRDIENLKDQISELNKKKPAPLAANLEMIKKDTSVLKEKSQELQRMFGKPFRAPLIKFGEALGITEQDLVAKYKDFCIKNPKLNDKYAIVDAFVKSFPEDKGPAAVLAFKKAAQEHTLETVSDATFKDLFLQALGYPRTMTPTICKDFIFRMQELFVNNYKPLLTLENVSKLTFDYNTRVPPLEEVQAIIRHLQLFDDLFARMRQADVTQALSVERLSLNGIHGDEVSRDYLKFPYRVRIVAEMPKIREFVNLLQDAYKDNRVYVIRDISLQSVADEAVKINDKAKDLSPRVVSSARRPSEPGKEQNPEDAPPETKLDYGLTLIGENKQVQADIEFDYYIFVGDEVKR